MSNENIIVNYNFYEEYNSLLLDNILINRMNYIREKYFNNMKSETLLIDNFVGIFSWSVFPFDLLKEIEELKEEKIYSNNTVVVINNSDLLVQKNRLRNNKIIFYPLLFCLVFICFQILKSSYNYLDNLEKK